MSGAMMAGTVQSRTRLSIDAHRILRLLAAGLATALLTMTTLSAGARGHGFSGHGSGHGFGGRGMHAELAGGRRHGNDSSINAASEERDRLLDKEIKSICRGC